MANALVLGGSIDALRKGRSAFEFAVLCGLADADISNASGSFSTLIARINALTPLVGTAPDALRQAGRGVQMAANSGLDITGLTTLAGVRTNFAALDPTQPTTAVAGITGYGLAE